MPQTTALTSRHEEAGAKLTDFAGWSMPLEYTGVIEEHRAVRESVGVFDVSHLGTVFLTGSEVGQALAWAVTKDPFGVAVGTSQYTLCATEDGGVVDDLIMYHLEEDRWMVVPNAANTAAVVAVLEEAADGRDVLVEDVSTGWAVIAVQGPRALATVTDALDARGATVGSPSVGMAEIPWLGVRPVFLDGQTGLVCRTGYTGEEGCEFVVPNAIAGAVWDAVVEAGATPVGLGARDTLRLEMGYPLHGNDLGPTISPYEARSGWAVSLDRADFRGRDALVAAKEAGPTRRLVGVRGETRRPLRPGLSVLVDGEEVGHLTSGGFSPTLEVGIGLALVEAGSVTEGDVAAVDVRGRPVSVTVVRPPFVDRSPGG